MDNYVFVVILAVLVIILCVCFILVQKFRLNGERNMELLKTMVGIVEAEDPNLDGHSLHVHNLTMAFYDFLPYSLRFKLNRTELEFASLLLDIGKLGIPREILGRKGKLKEEEWILVKNHPEIGLRILGSVKGFDRVSKWILYHHERVDGGGYHGLKGNEIPLASRIIAITDTYSAITMTRSYKPSMAYEEAIVELRLSSGSQLDSELVDIFCSIPLKTIDSCLEDVRNRIKFIRDQKHDLAPISKDR